MDHQLEILRLAKNRGWDQSRLTEAQYEVLTIEVRSKSELVVDAARAMKSRAKNKLGIGQVPVAKAEANAAVCRSNECNRFRLLDVHQRTIENGKPVVKIVARKPACDGCNCKSKWLDAKWADNSQECPIVNPATGNKYWSNRGS